MKKMIDVQNDNLELDLGTWERHYTSSQILPEKRLMWEILFQARDDILNTKNETERNRAIAWIKSTSTDWIFHFESICDHLGISAITIRRKLLSGEPSRAIYRKRI